jgi:hypothetical protein
MIGLAHLSGHGEGQTAGPSPLQSGSLQFLAVQWALAINPLSLLKGSMANGNSILS